MSKLFVKYKTFFEKNIEKMTHLIPGYVLSGGANIIITGEKNAN
jgi:hypothetical protein